MISKIQNVQIPEFQNRTYLHEKRLWALFTNFLTPGLTREVGNPLDDWLITTHHRAGYLIPRLIRELKIW